jgi:hypothetical protein
MNQKRELKIRGLARRAHPRLISTRPSRPVIESGFALKGQWILAVERHNPRKRHSSINALAKHLHRQYRNVFDDVKTMERLGLVEKDASGHFYVPWDEIDATFKLAA